MRIYVLMVCAGLLTACSTVQDMLPSKTLEESLNTPDTPAAQAGAVPAPADATVQPGLAVNSYLWSATLDTLKFMPLASTDPVGGVIITEWYNAPENPSERLKVTVYILDKNLRADALRVATFRQVSSNAGWVNAQVNPETNVKLENAILNRARELRLAAVEKESEN